MPGATNERRNAVIDRVVRSDAGGRGAGVPTHSGDTRAGNIASADRRDGVTEVVDEQHAPAQSSSVALSERLIEEQRRGDGLAGLAQAHTAGELRSSGREDVSAMEGGGRAVRDLECDRGALG